MTAYRVVCLTFLGLIAYCANYASSSVRLSHVSTIYLPYNITDAGEQVEYLKSPVKQVSYDPEDKLIYAAGVGVLHVVNASDPTNLTREHSMFDDGADLTDVEVCQDYVMVGVDNRLDRAQGQLRIYKKYSQSGNDSLALLQTIDVGAVPDMILPRPDCRTIFVVLEGEAYTDQNGTFQDPVGAVVIVHFGDGVEGDIPVSVKKLDFKSYDDKYVESLKPSGVRFVFQENNNKFSNDVEPEYITIDDKTNTAYVTLQENNGVAEVDLNTETIKNIHGLGYKQWGTLDASDMDKGIEITFWPIRAWYLPDNIKFHEWKGRKLVFTANEGDAKEYANFNETQRGRYFTDLDESIPKMVRDALGEDSQLGRLQFSRVDGQDENGTYHALYTYGGRSFSIWDVANNKFELLYDSGRHIEETTALQCPHLFNTDGQVVDERSDDKGPETETLDVAEIDGRLYIFVGNERPGTIFVYSLGKDVTQPRFEQIFCDGIPNDGRTIMEKFAARELYAVDPEDIRFVDVSDSPADYPVLIVAGAVSGTVSILRIHTMDEPDEPDEPTPTTPMPPPCNDKNTDKNENSSARMVLHLPAIFLGVLLSFYFQSTR